MVIRSYERVFRLNRRIYAVGDWQIPVPNGIPLLGFGYAVGALLAALIFWHLPLFGWLFGWVPWPMRYVLLPVWVAMIGMTFSPDGRRADLFLVTWLCLSGRRVCTRVRRPSLDWGGKLRVRYDASDVVLHRGGRINGPARAEFRTNVCIEERWDGRYAEGSPDGGPLAYDVAPGETLKVRP